MRQNLFVPLSNLEFEYALEDYAKAYGSNDICLFLLTPHGLTWRGSQQERTIPQDAHSNDICIGCGALGVFLD